MLSTSKQVVMDLFSSSFSSSSSSPLATSLTLFSVVSLVTLYFNSVHREAQDERTRKETELTWYTGACHCYKVNFKLKAPKHLVVWDCNCSLCFMKKNWHFIIPAKDFELNPESEEAITEYKFNTKVAKHKFCKFCGVQAFYHPRSNPDGIAVTLACIPVDQIKSYEIRKYDGQNWEAFFGTADISKFSKATQLA